MKTTKLEGLKIDYKVRRSEEASRPRIDHKLGKFTVVVPEELELDPEELLDEKSSWILKKRKEFLQFKRKIPERDLRPGGSISILGEEREIIVETRRSNSLDRDVYLAEHLVERTSLKDQLEKLLREEARTKIKEKIEEYSPKISEDHEKVFIRDQQTRWGSCSNKSNLSFNWRLILAPEEVLEYVVAHELTHLEQKDHSEEFWSRIREIYPGYREPHNWLEEYSAELVFDSEL